MAIEGLKLIYQTGGVSNPDDPSFPFKLHLILSSPKSMEIAFHMMYGGTEEVIIRGKELDVLIKYAKKNEFTEHPRFISLTIIGPDGLKLEAKDLQSQEG